MWILTILPLSLGLKCLDEQGNKVDWWSAYKFPEEAYGKYSGQTYAYMDQNYPKLQIQDQAINSPKNFIDNTLSEISSKSQFVLYNDEPGLLDIDFTIANIKGLLPNDDYDFTVAHAKGIMAYDDDEAVFIMHSVPKWPGYQNNTINPEILLGEQKYGQNLACVSISTQNLFNIAGIFSITKPEVYYHTSGITNANLTAVINKEQPSENYGTTEVVVGDETWLYIAKSNKYEVNIWDQVIPDVLKSDMEVESWGRPYLDSYCTGYDVVNIEKVTIGTYWWSHYEDHAKWGTSKDQMCFGDMNRMSSQDVRGGGALCTKNSDIFAEYSNVITEDGSCTNFI